VNRVSTHVLDTARGHPAERVPVSIDVRVEGSWQRVGEAVTGTDGRVAHLASLDLTGPVTCRLTFGVHDYLIANHGGAFFYEVAVFFEAEPEQHYHLPLLLSPFGYSVYRGS
jgi:5-hydroxyisourate hydrolase